MIEKLGKYVTIKTGKLDVNASSQYGIYPFFTCARNISRIDTYSFEGESVLVAGNGDLNVKYYNGKFDAYQRTYVIQSINANNLNLKYLYHFLSNYITVLRDQSIGGVIKYIKLNHLTDAKIPLPPLETQQKIAAILDKADELVQNDKKTLEKYDQLAQSVFLEMFGDPMMNQKGWEIEKLGNSLTENPRIGTIEPAIDNGILKIVRVGELGEKKVNIFKSKYSNLKQKDLPKFLLKDGDILLARAIGSESHLGKCSIFRRIGHDVVFDSHVMRLRFNSDKILPEFFYSWLRTKGGRKRFLMKSRKTAVQFNINTKQISDIDIPIPNIELQIKYIEKLHFIEQQQKLTRQSLQRSEELFQGLMQGVFRGGKREVSFN